jgi:predicted RNase H-like HicB family nuclease
MEFRFNYMDVIVETLDTRLHQARSLDSVMERIRKAIELCLDVEGAPGEGT